MACNCLGMQTLVQREVGRFMKVYIQTLLSPLVTTVLYFAIFALGMPIDSDHRVLGVPMMEFLAPGLVMMSMAQNAFANTSSSITIAKVQGTMVDTLMAPLSPAELLAGYITGGVLRGLLVGAVSLVGLSFFIPVSFHSGVAILSFGVLGCVLMASLGLAAGLWADKFDHIAAVTNFIITPMTFLSGTFYTLERLPEWAQSIAHVNPFFHMIDGFRFGFIGAADYGIMTGFWILFICTAASIALAWSLLSTGYKIKS